MLHRLDGVSGGAFTKTLIAAGKESFEEGLQEAVQQFAQNVIAKKYYDKDRDLMDGLAENAGAGAVTGALFSLLTHAIGAKVGAKTEQGRPAPPAAKQTPVIDPAASYRPDEESLAKVRELVQREAAGDNSVPFQTALASVYANPNLHALYTIEKHRVANEQPLAPQAPLATPPVTPVAPAVVPAAVPVPEVVQPQPVVAAPVPEVAASTPALDPRLAAARLAGANANTETEPETVAAPPAPVQTPPSAPTTETVSATPNVAVQPAAPVVAAANPPAATTQTTTETGPAWQKLAGTPESLVERIAFDSAQLAEREGGLGKKSASYFTETSDPADLFKDVTANASDRSQSRKLGVLLSPDGSHVLVGTAYANGGKHYVTAFDGSGKPKATQFKKLVESGYKLIASLKTTEPTKGFVVTYSAQEWGGIADSVRSQKQAAKATASAVEEQLHAAGVHNREAEKEEGGETGGRDQAAELEGLTNADDVAPAEAAAAAEVQLRGFSKDQAHAIFDAIAGADPAMLTTVSGLADLIGKSKRSMRAFGEALKALMNIGLSPAISTEILREEIYGAYTIDPKSKDTFAKSILQSIGATRIVKAEEGGDGSDDGGSAGESATPGSSGQGTETGADASTNAKIAAAASDVDTNPTDAQKKSGDYEKGLISLGGMDIEIENPKGSTRSGKDASGKAWSAEMPAHYGQILGVEGAEMGENDQHDLMDIFIGEHPDSGRVFVIDQKNPKTGKFEEHKVMYGFQSREQAVSTYVAAFSDGSGPSRLGEVTDMTKEDFNDWIQEGDTHRALSYGKQFRATARFSAERQKSQVATPARVGAAWEDALDTARANGIDVSVLQGLHERGVYSPRAIALTVADPLNPSHDNLVLLFHEIGHDVFRFLGLPAKLQEAYHRAIAGLSKPEGFKTGTNDFRVSSEEVLVERAARNLAAEGFNASDAKGIAQRMLRYLKRIYNRVALTIQKGLLGTVSPELAQDYFEARLRSFLAGDPPMSLLSFLGGPRLTAEQRGQTFTTADVLAGFFDAGTAEMQYREALPETVAAMRFNRGVAQMLERGNTRSSNDAKRPYIPERLPPAAERALGEGSLRAAARIAREVHEEHGHAGATEPTRGKETAALNRQLKPKEAQALRAWAEKSGLMLDPAEFTANWRKHGSVEGSEHQVSPTETGRVFKRTDTSLHGTWLEYLHRLALHNALFPETRMEFHGLMDVPEGDGLVEGGGLYAVVSQKTIDPARGATRQEVEAELAKMGFRRFRGEDYYNPATGVVIQDLHDENAIINKKGSLIIFDPIPVLSKPADFAEGGMLHNQPRSEVRYSDRGLAFTPTSDPHIISRDLNSPEKVKEDVAAYNVLHDLHRMAYTVFERQNPGMLTLEQFTAAFTNADTPATEKIAARNEELKANGFPEVDPTLRPHDLLAEPSQMQASDKAYRYAWGLREHWTERRKSSEWFMRTAGDRLNRNNMRLHELMKRYTEMDLQFSNARDELKVLHNEFLTDLKGTIGSARRFGTLTQVLAQIDQRISNPLSLAKQYLPVINRLYARLTEDRSGKFIDMLQKVADLDIDWKTTGTKEAVDLIAKMVAPTDPELKQLESRAMASITVAFAKSNEHVMEFLGLARSDALEERAKLNDILRDAVGDTQNAITTAKELARKLPRLAVKADRLLTKLEELKEVNHAHLDEMRRAQAFIDMHAAALPGLQNTMVQLERTIGARTMSWEATNGAEYFVAPKAGASLEQVMGNKKVFKLAGVEGNEDIVKDIQQNNAWLASVPESQRGAVWNTVRDMTTKLEHTVALAGHELVIKRSTVNTFLGSIVDKLEGLGLPSSRAAAMRMRRYLAERHAATADADNLGIKWKAAEAKAMEAMGLKGAGEQKFQRLVFQSALSFAEKNPDIRAGFKSEVDAFNALLPQLRRHLERDPDTAARLAKPGAWAALEAYYHAAYPAMEFINGYRKKLGIKIQEVNPDGFKIEREPIGSTFFTAMRRISREAVRTYHDMRELGWLGKENGKLESKRIADEYEADRAKLEERVKGLFTPEVWQDFVRPLALRDGRSAFYGPRGVDGITPVALRENVLKAFEGAGGSAVKFAENLYSLEGRHTSESQGEFVGKTLQGFQEFFDSLHNTQKDHDDSVRMGIPTPPRLLQDARISESWPGEWMEYQTYGRYEMHQMINTLAAQGAFGRNVNGMRQDLQTTVNQLQGKAELFKKIADQVEAAFPDKKGRALQRLIQQEVERRGESYTVLSEAQRNTQTARYEQGQFEALMKMQGGLALEMRPFMEMVSAMAGLTVQGPGTALMQVADFGQPFLKLGIGPAAFRVIKESVKSFAAEQFGTLAQLFHTQIGWRADQNARRVRNGIVDPDAKRKFADALTGLMNDPTMATNAATRQVFKVARGARLLTSSGFGRAAEGSKNAYVTLKPHALFSQVVQQMSAGFIDGWTSGFEDIVNRAAEYFQDPANAGNLTDPAFKFERMQDLGYSRGFLGIGNDERGFKYFSTSLARYGLSLEQMARDLAKRRATDASSPALTDEQFRVLASQVQNEVTLESNPATRASSMFTNPVLRMAAPLISWSISKSHDSWEAWAQSGHDPDQQERLQSLRDRAAALPGTGAGGVGSGVVPGPLR
jgi:hypothetical protein